MIETTYPEAPPCPSWCEGHDVDGWDVHPAAVTKTCRKTVECDGGAQVALERFATLEDYRVVVDDPVVRVFTVDALTTASAAALSHTIGRLAEIADEPVRAVA